MDEKKAAAIFKALGDERRIHILKLLTPGSILEDYGEDA